jgi:hypothetical protein
MHVCMYACMYVCMYVYACMYVYVCVYVCMYLESLNKICQKSPTESIKKIPVGARFSAPVQTGPGAHPASYKTDIGSFPGVKRPGRGVDPHLTPRLKKE